MHLCGKYGYDLKQRIEVPENFTCCVASRKARNRANYAKKSLSFEPYNLLAPLREMKIIRKQEVEGVRTTRKN